MPFVFDPFRFKSLHSEDAQTDPLGLLSTVIPAKKDRDRDLVRFLSFAEVWFSHLSHFAIAGYGSHVKQVAPCAPCPMIGFRKLL